VAVSGGPDSLALLHALHASRERLGLAGLASAHYDHGLRGAQSAAEAAFVAEFCASISVPCTVETAPVDAIKQSSQGSLQEAAREARYTFLNRAADLAGADFIATAHNQDDQIETVLINLMRGAGIDGLRGIPHRNGRLIRPLLDVSRAAIEVYCAQHGLSPRRDPSNDDPSHYLRNRIRLELLPLLERDYHPGVRDAILRLSHSATIDSAYLDTQARAALDRIFAKNALDIAGLLALDEALRRRVIRLAIERARGTREGVSERHVELILALASGDRKAGLTIPDPECRILRQGRVLKFASEPAAEAYAPYSIPLSCPSTVTTPSGWQISVDTKPLPTLEGAYTAVLDMEAVDLSTLVVRSRENGDRIDPLGMGGKSKKLQDLFVDRKVAKNERDGWPVIADKNGPLWIPRLTQAEQAKTTERTRQYLFLTAATNEL
jgi:tRNA(Ile)-lysidine synthase